MTFVYIILILLLLLFIIIEISCYLVYGPFISKEFQKYFLNLEKSDYSLNSFDSSILIIRNTKSIYRLSFRLLCKYYITGVGQVPRWTKLHTKIEEYYLIAIEKEIVKTFN